MDIATIRTVAAAFFPRLASMRAEYSSDERSRLSLRGYQACMSPQWGQLTEAVTTAWKAEPQRQM
jgi:hypothetical protein